MTVPGNDRENIVVDDIEAMNVDSSIISAIPSPAGMSGNNGLQNNILTQVGMGKC